MSEHRILVVEDNKAVAKLISSRINSELDIITKVAHSYEDAKAIMNENDSFFIAILDLNLPDAPDGEIVDLVLSKEIPSIVLTGTLDDDLRKSILSKNVVDYIVKEGMHAIDYVIHLIKRLKNNRDIKALVVDDTATFRHLISRMLELHKFNVITAVDGIDALEKIKEHSDIKLILTDYEMPKMNGFELVSELRKDFSKDMMAIIGLSANTSETLSAQFLKKGANDFLSKPFLNEEFYCRVTQNVEILELIHEIREASIRDYLTGLYNRRYLYEIGNNLHSNAVRDNLAIAVGMVDIDFFKKINDTYGHDVGDIALKHVAGLLTGHVRKTDVVSRCGGEEFCVILTNVDRQRALLVFGKMRKVIEKSEIQADGKTIKMTISVGVCTSIKNSLESMIKTADELLYEAKESGRNRVVIDI
ncbi:response regulator receiver modulated diguanylate cyclase [Candidatus Magnetomorum sp. HK-1]|nr:response regulator receiver modulated diguanylate cyclase [Candidatus Magnetomorum sp. HK-1]